MMMIPSLEVLETLNPTVDIFLRCTMHSFLNTVNGRCNSFI